MTKLKRIHWHWTAGADGVNEIERDSYNWIVGRDGLVTEGSFPWQRQIPPLNPGRYAAHTLSANSWAGGLALDAMAGASERPFNAGRYPITEAQLASAVRLCARLCRDHGITVDRKTVLTHAEVGITLGIPQRNKWDITWIPGMVGPGNPIAVGDVIREMVRKAMK